MEQQDLFVDVCWHICLRFIRLLCVYAISNKFQLSESMILIVKYIRNEATKLDLIGLQSILGRLF